MIGHENKQIEHIQCICQTFLIGLILSTQLIRLYCDYKNRSPNQEFKSFEVLKS